MSASSKLSLVWMDWKLRSLPGFPFGTVDFWLRQFSSSRFRVSTEELIPNNKTLYLFLRELPKADLGSEDGFRVVSFKVDASDHIGLRLL